MDVKARTQAMLAAVHPQQPPELVARLERSDYSVVP
jgi:hypothetical protein